MSRLDRDFFSRDTITVAQELLGKQLIFKNQQIIINETEAYIGEDDPACHASCGKTNRNAVMYDRAGFSYVYLIYGMYHCLNFVTERKDFPAAVLIRGGINGDKVIDGPGKLCKYLNIDKSHNYLDIVTNQEFYIEDIGISSKFNSTPRIGISKGKEKLWRFVIDFFI